MSKQTATEWLFAHLLPFLPFSDAKEREYFRKCLAEAKAMEEDFYKISNDKIEKAATTLSFFAMPKTLFEYGAKWYKEQLENKKRNSK